MFPNGDDICVRKHFPDNCPVCNCTTVMGLYEKSDLMNGFRFNRRYHIMCQKCKSLYQISDSKRQRLYQTLWERIFGHRFLNGGQP